ncbi:integrase [Enterobacteriaceae bacterium ENNIH3]|nr:integrase [Enterobacteriaceae bacterium ENNIH3]AUV09687.1 integrase [Enterobacteriaceae bacterium ENNIH2]
MARKRKNLEDYKLPPRVYKTAYCYYFKPTSKESISLGKISMSVAQVWAKYEALIRDLADVMTFAKLWGKFLSSPYYLDLSARTQSDYLHHQKKLLAVFGKVKADSIKPEHVRAYMDKRGLQSRTQANHEMSSMSRVYRWGYERGFVKGNPCQGVSKFPKKDRDVYTPDEHYYEIYEAANIELKVAMEISYLCAARQGDVLDAKWTDVRAEGIFIEQNKTGKKQIKKWTPRLQAAIDLASKLPGNKMTGYIVPGPTGGKLNPKTLNNWWLKAKQDAEKKLACIIPSTFHDIKAKSISDYEGSSKDKQIFSGHKTEGQVAVYDRKTKITPTLDLPVLK